MPNLTWVKPSKDQEPATIVLWERSDDHPGGEVYILGDSGPVQVAMTPAVTQRLKRGQLVEVDRPGKGAGPVAAAEVSPPSQTAVAVAKTPPDSRGGAKRAAGSRVGGL